MPEPPSPRIDGRYKVRNEDFEVVEVPVYTPSGEGTHTWLWIEKTGLATLGAIEELATATNTNKRDYGYAGMKDAQAVTRQWLSIEHVDPERFAGLVTDSVRVLEVSRHNNKLKPGHLRGNRFRIVLRDVSEDPAAVAQMLESLQRNLTWCVDRGVPNYFGEQRFGKRGSNLDQGLDILRDPKPKRKAYKFAPRVLKLLMSSVQSEVFNRVLLARLDSFDRIVDGDLAYIHDKGATFAVQDIAAEQLRCDAFEISPTGPLPGPKMLRAQGRPGELEAQILAELDLTPEAFSFLRSHPGGRRPLRLQVAEASADGAEDTTLRLQFELPAGCYATSVLRLLLTDPPWFGA